MFSDMVKHQLEDPRSWDFFQKRQLEQDEPLEHRELKIKRYKPHQRKSIPRPLDNTFHAMMIDAGSQGTRIHLYEFEQRILYSKKEIDRALNGMMLSSPTTDSRWTNRLKPGMDSLASIKNDDDLIKATEEYLNPLLSFAKTVLAGKEESFGKYPIFLKATGGLRTLPTHDRIRLINAIRKVLHDTTFNPFQFEDERARVISGEEEAIYGWAAVNYIKGTLVKASEGIGTVLNPTLTYGMIEMGGASTQIAYFEPNGDVMANLFKLQIGGARHWNVYVHSFLYFGVNGAWDRLNARLRQDESFGLVVRNATGFVNPCLPAGSSIPYSSWIHTDGFGHLLPRSNPLSTVYNTIMYNEQPDFELCREKTRRLLRKEANLEWVDFSHDGDSSFAGIYQPPLPVNETGIGGFIATSNFADTWQFLQLNETSPIFQVEEKAKVICNMDTKELDTYNNNLKIGLVDDKDLPQMCFRAVLVYEMLTTGYGFPRDYEITALVAIDGFKLGWSLGSILFEVNALPWQVAHSVKVKSNVTTADDEDVLNECGDMDDDDDVINFFDDDDSVSKKSKKSKKASKKSSKKESSNIGVSKDGTPTVARVNSNYLSRDELPSRRGALVHDHHGMVSLFFIVAFVALLSIVYRRRSRGHGYRPIPSATSLEC